MSFLWLCPEDSLPFYQSDRTKNSAYFQRAIALSYSYNFEGEFLTFHYGIFCRILILIL
ncbi:hypothetical protein [Anabaena azotica]|uniref:hypothetical protein n=1 Tax=Anabaena azotica TaxID=197653 RepID=UPI001A7E5A9A|nr:hypothetical protein [Anabaena azotica]